MAGRSTLPTGVTSYWATRETVVFFLVCSVLLGMTSAGILKQRSTQMEWFDPMENVTESDYYSLTAAMAALNPPPGWDAAAQGYRPGRATNTHSCNHIRGVPRELRSSQHMKPSGLSNFYQKYTEAYGIPIVASNSVSDDAMKRACYITRFLFADHSRVRQSYYARSGRVGVIGANELTTSIPEHSWLGSGWNQRARGLGATDAAPICTCGEENILCYRSDRWFDEDIMIHELAHGVHLLGAKYAITGWQSRLRSLYNSARRTGRWANTYAMSTENEYFAEGSQSFFDCNPYYPVSNGIHNDINTQSKLRSYDPGLFQLVYDVFPCNNTYLLRCKHSREEELQQPLRMNCDINGGGETTTTTTNTTTTTTTTTTNTTTTTTTTNTTTTTTTTPAASTTRPAASTTTTVGGGGRSSQGTTTRAPPPPTTTTGSGRCRDINSSCPQWARYGYCHSYRTYMTDNCQRSCNFCGCQDRGQHCQYWASSGECGRNPDYMHVYCKQSCNVC